MRWSALIIIIRRNAAQKRDLHSHMHRHMYKHTYTHTYSSWAIELTRCTSGLPESQSKLSSGSESATSAALQLIAPFQRAHTHTNTHIYTHTHRAIQIKTGKTTRKINFCFSKPMPPSPPFPLLSPFSCSPPIRHR